MSLSRMHAISGGVLLAAMAALIPAAVARAAANGPVTPWWWDLALAATYFLTGLGLARSFFTQRDPRVWALLVAAVTALGVLSFPWVAEGRLPVDAPPWIAMFVPTAAAALGFCRRWYAAAALALGLGLALYWSQSSPSWPADALRQRQDLVFLAVCTLCVTAGLEALRASAQSVDRAERRTVQATAEAGLQAAREVEDAWWDALLHDELLATLGAARAGAAAEEVRRLAGRAIGALERERPKGVVPVEALGERLVWEHGDAVQVASRADSGTLSGELVDAVAAAVGEAVRNARRHGGADVEVRIRGLVSASRIELEVSDTGPGFDRSAVARDRMGIAVSILGRMAAVGGQATVLSSRGTGTRVVLTWPSR